ncbi:hypothetical protein [Sodalis sp. RH23]|uniref:hypothetical protein n=1 Tax=unclassified Sodalis (in: enterobacteria) TaxID=2636512 RepID=UPI0039B44CFC
MSGKSRWIKFICFMCLMSCFSQAFANDLDLYSLDTASFAYHIYAPKEGDNQYFKNQLVAIERKVHKNSDYSFFAGTFINSESNRCVLLGMGKNWVRRNQWSFEGLYAYAGEFVFTPFERCGDDGFYQDIKRATGIGFAPYIYHGVKYDVNSHVSVRSGILLPGIVIMSLQLRF